MGSNEEDSSSPVSILRKASTPTSGISSQTPSRQRSSTTAGGGRDPANWKSYHNDANFPEQESAELAIPKFDVDPDIPLENMAALSRPVLFPTPTLMSERAPVCSLVTTY